MPSLDDLRPKSFQVEVRGVKLNCKPLRLSHGLLVGKLGEAFQDTSKLTKQEIKQIQSDVDELVIELIPDLKDVELNMADTVELLSQLTDGIQPSDNEYLEKAGVNFNDPKAPNNKETKT